jgi:hypothetical protein
LHENITSYPDLPKGYQITQHETPICKGGSVIIKTNSGKKNIRLNHIHLEEDAGKSMHDEESAYSNIDYNRAGVPLIEIVTEPGFAKWRRSVCVHYRIKKIGAASGKFVMVIWKKAVCVAMPISLLEKKVTQTRDESRSKKPEFDSKCQARHRA